jgi:hypothetical protein
MGLSLKKLTRLRLWHNIIFDPHFPGAIQSAVLLDGREILLSNLAPRV